MGTEAWQGRRDRRARSGRSDAFYDDRVASWLFDGDQRRLDQLRRGFALFINRLYLAAGECLTTGHVDGGALWVPPGTWQVPAAAQARVLWGT